MSGRKRELCDDPLYLYLAMVGLRAGVNLASILLFLVLLNFLFEFLDVLQLSLLFSIVMVPQLSVLF